MSNFSDSFRILRFTNGQKHLFLFVLHISPQISWKIDRNNVFLYDFKVSFVLKEWT